MSPFFDYRKFAVFPDLLEVHQHFEKTFKKKVAACLARHVPPVE